MKGQLDLTEQYRVGEQKQHLDMTTGSPPPTLQGEEAFIELGLLLGHLLKCFPRFLCSPWHLPLLVSASQAGGPFCFLRKKATFCLSPNWGS